MKLRRGRAIGQVLRRKKVFFLLLGLLICLHAWSLTRYPAPHADEAWYASRAWGYIQTGHAFGALDAGVVEQYDHYWIANEWLITVLQSLALRPFAQPLLAPLRVFTLLLGLGLLAVNYLIAHKAGGAGLAEISTLLLAASRAFFHSAHLARSDIFTALLGYAALAILLYDPRGRFTHGLLAGLITGLAVETHPNALVFAPAAAGVYLLLFRKNVLRTPSLWGYALGGGLGVIYYLGLHYWPDPQTFWQINGLLFRQTQVPPLLSGNSRKILQGFGDLGGLLLASAGPMILLAILALPRLFTRRTPGGNLILTLNGVLLTAFALLIPNKTGHYAIYLAPAFLLLCGAYLADFSRAAWRGKVGDILHRVLVWSCVLSALGLSLLVLPFDLSTEYRRTQAEINAVVRPGDVVMGPQIYWFGLYDRRYLAWELLFYYPALHPGAGIGEVFDQLGVDVFIIDPNMRALISDTISPDSRWYYYHLPQKELMDILAQDAELVAEIGKDRQPDIQIYRLKP